MSQIELAPLQLQADQIQHLEDQLDLRLLSYVLLRQASMPSDIVNTTSAYAKTPDVSFGSAFDEARDIRNEMILLGHALAEADYSEDTTPIESPAWPAYVRASSERLAEQIEWVDVDKSNDFSKRSAIINRKDLNVVLKSLVTIDGESVENPYGRDFATAVEVGEIAIANPKRLDNLQ